MFNNMMLTSDDGHHSKCPSSIVFLFWGHHLQEGYEKRVVLQRNDISDPSRSRKGKNEVWKDLIEQVVRDVVG